MNAGWFPIVLTILFASGSTPAGPFDSVEFGIATAPAQTEDQSSSR